jgi:hypothetical protein
MAVAALAVGAAIWATASWLLHDLYSIPGALNQANTRIEAVRTALAAGAGTGAAVGLLLAFRRQQHQEVATALTELDATEKRITELYGKAVEQLGSDKAAVRLGGLYALERLAQGNPDHRQTITNVICAYLRMPFPVETDLQPPTTASEQPEGVPGQADPRTDAVFPSWTREAWVQEREVRLTAQDILARHLKCPTDQDRPPEYWPVMLNLVGAHLIDTDFSACRLLNSRFEKATFSGDTWFEETTFSGDTWFGETTFSGDTWFEKATFSQGAGFEEATFERKPAFGGALVINPILTHTWPAGWMTQAEHGPTTLVEAAGMPE